MTDTQEKTKLLSELNSVKRQISENNINEANEQLKKIAISYAKTKLENASLKNTDNDYLILREIKKDDVFSNKAKEVLINVINKDGNTNKNIELFKNILEIENKKPESVKKQVQTIKKKQTTNADVWAAEKRITDAFNQMQQEANNKNKKVYTIKQQKQENKEIEQVVLNAAAKTENLFDKTEFIENNKKRIKHVVIKLRNTKHIQISNENDYLLQKKKYDRILDSQNSLVEYKKVIKLKNLQKEEAQLKDMGIYNLVYSNGIEEKCASVSYVMKFQKPTFGNEALVKTCLLYMSLPKNKTIKEDLELIKLGFKHKTKRCWYLDTVVDAYEFDKNDVETNTMPSCRDLIDIGVHCNEEKYDASLGKTRRYKAYKILNGISNAIYHIKHTALYGILLALLVTAIINYNKIFNFGYDALYKMASFNIKTSNSFLPLGIAIGGILIWLVLWYFVALLANEVTSSIEAEKNIMRIYYAILGVFILLLLWVTMVGPFIIKNMHNITI